VTMSIFATLAVVLVNARHRRELVVPAVVLDSLVVIQIALGAATVLSRRNPWINSFHVVCGALVLTTSLVLTLRSWRGQIAKRGVRSAEWERPTATEIRNPASNAIRNRVTNAIRNPIRNPQSAIRTGRRA
jgi:heme A synthase